MIYMDTFGLLSGIKILWFRGWRVIIIGGAILMATNQNVCRWVANAMIKHEQAKAAPIVSAYQEVLRHQMSNMSKPQAFPAK